MPSRAYEEGFWVVCLQAAALLRKAGEKEQEKGEMG